MSVSIEMNSENRLLYNNQKKKMKQRKPVDSMLSDLRDLDEEQDFHTPTKIERVYVAGNRPFTTPEERKQITNLFVDFPITFHAQNNVLLKYGYSSLALKKIKELRASIATRVDGSTTRSDGNSDRFRSSTIGNNHNNSTSLDKNLGSTPLSTEGTSLSSSLSFSTPIIADSVTAREVRKDILEIEEEHRQAIEKIDAESMEHMDGDESYDHNDIVDFEYDISKDAPAPLTTALGDNHTISDADSENERKDDDDEEENEALEKEAFEIMKKNQEDNEVEDKDEEDDESFETEAMMIMRRKREEDKGAELDDDDEEGEEEDDEEENEALEKEAFEIMKKNQEDNEVEDKDEEDDESFETEAMMIMRRKREEDKGAELDDDDEEGEEEDDEEENEALQRSRGDDVDTDVSVNHRTRRGRSAKLVGHETMKVYSTRLRPSTELGKECEGVLAYDRHVALGRLSSKKVDKEASLMYTGRTDQQKTPTKAVDSSQIIHSSRSSAKGNSLNASSQIRPNVEIRANSRRKGIINMKESSATADSNNASTSSPISSIDRENKKRRAIEATSSNLSSSLQTSSSKRSRRPTTPLLSSQEVEEARENSPYRSLFNNSSHEIIPAPQLSASQMIYPSTPTEEPESSQTPGRRVRRAVETTMSQSEDRVIRKQRASSSSSASSLASTMSISSFLPLSPNTRSKSRKDGLDNIDNRAAGFVVEDGKKGKNEASIVSCSRVSRNRKKVETLNIEEMSSAKNRYGTIPSSAEDLPGAKKVSSIVTMPSPSFGNVKTLKSVGKRKSESPLSDRVTRSRGYDVVHDVNIAEAPSDIHPSMSTSAHNRVKYKTLPKTISKKAQVATMAISGPSDRLSTPDQLALSFSRSAETMNPSTPEASFFSRTHSQSQDQGNISTVQSKTQQQQYHESNNDADDNPQENLLQSQKRSESHWLTLKPITSWISSIFSSPVSKSQAPEETRMEDSSNGLSRKQFGNDCSLSQHNVLPASSGSSSSSPALLNVVRNLKHRQQLKKSSRRSAQKMKYTKEIQTVVNGSNSHKMSNTGRSDDNSSMEGPRPAIGFFEMIRNWFGF